MATEFKTLMSIRIKDAKEGMANVFHKPDGERFGQKNTVKLNVKTLYDVRVTFRPALHLQRLMVQGEKRDAEVVINKEKDDESRTYVIEFDTSTFEVSKRAKRKEIPFVFEFQDGVYMKMLLQCKLYPENETDHSRWGQALTTLELDCKRPEGQSFVLLDRQRFL